MICRAEGFHSYVNVTRQKIRTKPWLVDAGVEYPKLLEAGTVQHIHDGIEFVEPWVNVGGSIGWVVATYWYRVTSIASTRMAEMYAGYRSWLGRL